MTQTLLTILAIVFVISTVIYVLSYIIPSNDPGDYYD